ncbi:hypothetical protein PP182_00065 [Maribacter sp. PR1]|uniref:Uncharacterized protein n=1 Tax=Maribacter cobaltidurans TaxID=1178778 RepID=A0ABU7INI4_9FLAO|nr:MULTISPECIES: hypothetical protein [Maribacter]MDC6387058.1 hypothetical protein [Maribacter sp. PR1]MEE1974444.1 hypothetical protein [Maribacter cobaltidurans]
MYIITKAIVKQKNTRNNKKYFKKKFEILLKTLDVFLDLSGLPFIIYLLKADKDDLKTTYLTK